MTESSMKDAAAEVGKKLATRLPPSTDHVKLAADYIQAVVEHAVDRTAGQGVIPSAFNVERAALMFEVSKRFGRLLNAGEIGALLRIQRSTALAVQRVMKATYIDESYALEIAASLVGAKLDGRGDYGEVKNGYRIVFASASSRSDFEEAMDRRGVTYEESKEDDGKDNLLFVDTAFDVKPHRIPEWGA